MKREVLGTSSFSDRRVEINKRNAHSKVNAKLEVETAKATSEVVVALVASENVQMETEIAQ